MATVFGNVKAISLLKEPYAGGNNGTAVLRVEMGAYVAANDNGKLGGGGSQFDVTTTKTLAAMIQDTRRDGKTVTIRGASRGEPGLQATTRFFADTFSVVDTGANLTFNLTDIASSEIDAAAGVHDQPIEINVEYSLA
jgi:hypothetical protein